MTRSYASSILISAITRRSLQKQLHDDDCRKHCDCNQTSSERGAAGGGDNVFSARDDEIALDAKASGNLLDVQFGFNLLSSSIISVLK